MFKKRLFSGLERIKIYTRHQRRRFLSEGPRPSQPHLGSSSSAIARFITRSPKFLRPTLSALQTAPITHVTAFLILHEITAIFPLFGLAAAFHYYAWLPPFFAEGAWVVAGIERFGKYFKSKGWIDAGEEAEIEKNAKELENVRNVEESKGLRLWARREGRLRWVIELATAYAVVKALLPLRIVVSVWGAPWFARWSIIPMSNAVKSTFRRKKTTSLGYRKDA